MLHDIPGDREILVDVDAVAVTGDLDPVAETVDVREAAAERLFVAEARPVIEPTDGDMIAVDVELVVAVSASDIVAQLGVMSVVAETVHTAVAESRLDLDGEPVL